MISSVRRSLAAGLAMLVASCGSGGGEGTGSGGSFDIDDDTLGMVAGVGLVAYIIFSDVLSPSTTEGPVQATRLFSGRGQFDPAAFATYGIVAFPSGPTSDDASRFRLFCEVFVGNLDPIEDGANPPSRQAVTVWPVLSTVTEDDYNLSLAEGCTRATQEYDATESRRVISAANAAGSDLSGRGPFFIAWSLGETYGTQRGQRLIYDMSKVTDATQARIHIQQWSREIAAGPTTWAGDWDGARRWIAIQRTMTNFGRPVDRILFGTQEAN